MVAMRVRMLADIPVTTRSSPSLKSKLYLVVVPYLRCSSVRSLSIISRITSSPVISDPSAYLWFYGKNQDVVEGGYSTTDFESGYQYCISVFE